MDVLAAQKLLKLIVCDTRLAFLLPQTKCDVKDPCTFLELPAVQSQKMKLVRY